MEIATHYATLGVTQSAEFPVIRAAYKALALNHHPDKTVHLAAEDRANRAALFRNIQEAWDVLSSPSLKENYDREFERNGKCIDPQRSTFHRPPSAEKDYTPSRRRSSILLTSPTEKRAFKAKVEQDLAYLREQRAKRDIQDSNMDVAGLKFMLQVWVDMAQKYDDDVLGDGFMRAHCAVQIQVYQAKIAARDREREDWLEDMSRPKTPATKSARTTTNSTSTMPRSAANYSRPMAHVPRTKPAAPVPARTHASEKARKEAARKADLDAKAAAVRAEKEKLKAKREALVRKEAERIARSRAKARPHLQGKPVAGRNARNDDASQSSSREKVGEDTSAAKPGVKKMCLRCEVVHETFAEWMECSLKRARQESEDQETFFQDV
ncbi:hypothetical protein N0V90_001609 [Kalmusia sp. IMI 367209]|nr:hypothetical protein N0V90_001609 [Kalmusia sp. IMI 367209]